MKTFVKNVCGLVVEKSLRVLVHMRASKMMNAYNSLMSHGPL